MSKIQATLAAVTGKDVIIWGARMTGLGAARMLRDNDVHPLYFVDSDPGFKNKTVAGLQVVLPAQLKQMIDQSARPTAILVAVALKETDILKSLEGLGITGVDVVSFQDNDAPYFTVDILGSCNLRCLSCPHSIVGHDVPRGSMRFEDFTQVIDKIHRESPDTTHISLYSWGEPLLHPKIDEIVKYVHGKGIAVALSSNLSFTFDERLERLIKAEPDYLKISVSGYYPDAYNSTHQGGNIDLVKSNLYRLKYFIDKHNKDILVDINYHLYNNNNGRNLEKFRELADELGFVISTTYALVMPLERVFDHIEGIPDPQTEELRQHLLVDIDEGIEISAEGSKPAKTCPFRENQININADLTVPVCCTVFQRGENIVAENYLETTVSEINKSKQRVKTCAKCMKLKLPEYNLGFNRRKWEQVANSKHSLDV